MIGIELDEWARDACYYYATSDDTNRLTSDAMSDYAFPATRTLDIGNGHLGNLLLVNLKYKFIQLQCSTSAVIKFGRRIHNSGLVNGESVYILLSNPGLPMDYSSDVLEVSTTLRHGRPLRRPRGHIL